MPASISAAPISSLAPISSAGWADPFEPFDVVAARRKAGVTEAAGAMVVAGMSGNGAGMISWPRCGAHDRQRASASFQQFGQVYCRHDMQKLNVLWKASSWWVVSSRSVSLRAAAIASSIDVSSDRTKFFRPRDRTLTPLSRVRGRADSNV